MSPYTVLLLYPDYLADDYGSDTFLAHVTAANRDAAVDAAKREAWRANGETPGCCEPDDFAPLLVLAGHHDAL